MLTPDRWARVRTLLEEIVARPADDRLAHLAAANISEPDIREEVESLLRAYNQAGDFLDTSPMPTSGVAATESDAMPVLAPGTRLGWFEVLGPLGAGGMGQVYRARDTRLERNVAVKVMAPELADSPSSRDRFESEARAISRLTHPNICVLHDVGVATLDDDADHPFLVMELVEGQTLSARLERGALPPEKALQYGIEIAGALGAAHSAGIVHRDLKPANIMLTKSGVKLLDFGLAALHSTASMPDDKSGGHGWLIAGTLPYMAPEQLEGRNVDARADIFAFGAVLYEMVRGRKAFEGENQATLISAILSVPYRSDSVTPPALDRVIRTCLAKDPDDRWTNMHDVRLQLQGIADAAPQHRDERLPAASTLRRERWRLALGTLAALLIFAGLLALGYWTPWQTPRPNSTQRLSIELGVDGTLPLTDVPIALSQDGEWLAFVARVDGSTPLLHVRRLDQLTALPLNGTEGASPPCFSPDGQWIAFFADVKLKKVPVTGGAVVTLADAPNPRGMWWAEDGTIVFAPNNRMGLLRISSVGGPTQQLTTLANGEITHRFPQVLPGGSAVLYTASSEVNIAAGSTVVLQPLPAGKPTIVRRGGYFGRYVPSGHIVLRPGRYVVRGAFRCQALGSVGSAGTDDRCR